MHNPLVRTLIALLVASAISACNSRTVEFQQTEESIESIPLSAKVYQPEGSGPFPAVVLLHGCSGILAKHHSWAEQLADWGYFALLVDSFTPRDVDKICAADDELWARFDTLRPLDVRSAVEYLRSLDQVDRNRIGVMGWSNGGTIALSLNERYQQPEGVAFKAVVAAYPSCWQFNQNFQHQGRYQFSAPMLLGVGAEDNWTRAENCEKLTSHLAADSQPVELLQYPDAFHDFDNPQQSITKLYNVRIEEKDGWGDVMVGYNKEAYTQFLDDVRLFLKENLDD